MTDFTPDQIERIEAAISKHHGTNWCAFTTLVISELTRTQWEPQVGEVYADMNGKHPAYFGSTGEVTGKIRPLTPDEVPALKVAIKALEVVVGKSYHSPITLGKANNALAKIAELTATNEDM